MMVGWLFLMIGIFVMLAFIGGVILLQVFLSRMESRLPGLILPCISLGLSLIPLVALLAFTVTTHTDVVSIEVERMQEIELRQQILEDRERIRWEYAHPGQPFPYLNVVWEGTTVNHLVDYGTIGGGANAWRILFLFIIGNIPTVILFAIYVSCRNGRKLHTKKPMQSDLDRMSLQDLG
ncbi:MAG: hypothetical protein FWC16_08125 [Defluviitaleaceae bacterium]|nr:hypothetical protein [Defluviitaleaceae bacterium]MCL2274879.1 hypothetical protein [Defluviitaleaceae bacterium]